MQLRRLRLDVSASRSSPVFMCFPLVACIYVLRTRRMHLCASCSSPVCMCFALVACIYVLCSRRMYLCALRSSHVFGVLCARCVRGLSKPQKQKTKTE